MGTPQVQRRDSARVFVIDPSDRVLMFKYRGREGAANDAAIWLTPGGGVDGDESLADAAARELAEETGIVVAGPDLGDVVATRTGTWCVPDGTIAFHGTDHYFLLRTDVVAPDTSRHTEWERDFIVGHKWWTADELRGTTEWIDVPGLADVLEPLLSSSPPTAPITIPWTSVSQRIHGCLLAGGIGDALGGAVEFLSRAAIVERFGPNGLSEMVSHQITDDTQMTLFTVEGLLDAQPGSEGERVRQAYLDWLATQTLSKPPAGAVGLAAQEWLYARRAPGNACLSGLRAGGRGDVNPNSKGCGTVMRSAPFGLLAFGAERAFELAADCARITHGHPTAAAAAGAFAAMVDHLVAGNHLPAAVDLALDMLGSTAGGDETRAALVAAVDLAGTGEPSAHKVATLGEGWVAEEALAIAVYCALVADYLWDGVLLAINHSGDSDSTGSICGNLLGAERGVQEIPDPWILQLEGTDTISSLANQLAMQPG